MTSNRFNEDTYNYDHFTPQEYHFEVFEGLAAGDRFQDAEVFTLEGQPARLSDYLRDKPLVLETGSMTCPMYGQSVRPMLTLATEYPELDFLLLYVREAHPGERVPAHRTQQEKIDAARLSRRRYDDNRATVVDTVDGVAHRIYGAMPNSVYVIDSDGTILFRSIWNNAEHMKGVLGRIASRKVVLSRDFQPVPPFSFAALRTLWMGGIVAVWDFVRGLPRLVAKHKEVGNM